jgi:hypothetical protein
LALQSNFEDEEHGLRLPLEDSEQSASGNQGPKLVEGGDVEKNKKINF